MNKEANLLGSILKKIANQSDSPEEYLGSMEPVANGVDSIKMKILAINRAEDKQKAKRDIVDKFEISCHKLVDVAIKTLKKIDPSDTDSNVELDYKDPNRVGPYLDLMDPRYDTGTEDQLREAFTEESIEDLTHIKIDYDPSDMFAAVKLIIYDKSYRFTTAEKNIAKSLLIQFNRWADVIFSSRRY